MFLLVVTSFVGLVASIAALIRAYEDQNNIHKRIQNLQHGILEAQRLLKQKGDLANEVAHEIKNPLTAILCSVETLDLLVGPSLEAEHRKSLLYIKDYSESLLRLITTFIDINRAEVGKLTCRRENLEIVPVAESVVGLLSSFATKRKLNLSLDFSDREIRAFADPILTKQILFNLIHNAIKFTPENGDVKVLIKADSDNKVSFRVIDTGSGIEPQRLPNIFDAYKTRSTPNNKNEDGIGLGLALTQTLVNLQGGTIRVESKLGQGTTFEVDLPAATENPRRSGKQKLLEGKPLSGCKFLVVDEDLGTRDSISSLLEAWGGMVDRVCLAAEALDAIATKEYKAVLLDESLSGVDGYELTKIIKTNHTNDNAMIILTSCKRDGEKNASAAGADLCLHKPFDSRRLLEALEDARQ